MIVSWKKTTVNNLMMISLLFTLFTSLVFFSVSTIPAGGDMTACRAIAAMNQFLFLATFTWTNALAIDITYTIYSFGSKSKAKLRYIGYLLYALGLPLLLTLITFGLHEEQANLNLSRTVYRENYLCFLNDSTVIYSLFLAPMYFLIFINIILCIACILRVTRKIEIASNDKDRTKKNVITCIKLSTCLGLGWVLLYVSLVFEEVWPIVLAFIELQGVFIVTANMIGWDCIKKIKSATERSATSRPTASTELRTVNSAQPSPAILKKQLKH